jgi:AmmeMemoRadiSam system protein A
MNEHYTPEEESRLLQIARHALEAMTAGESPPLPDLDALPEVLREARACFVTLRTVTGDLRGCTGTLVARQPLAHEVSQTTVQTAQRDPRFPPLTAMELPTTRIEISVLTVPVERHFRTPDEIPALLRPHLDGVILVIGGRRATFLPQVWDRAPDPESFLDLLCQKMGMPAQAWRRADVQLFTYQTVSFEEAD